MTAEGCWRPLRNPSQPPSLPFAVLLKSAGRSVGFRSVRVARGGQLTGVKTRCSPITYQRCGQDSGAWRGVAGQGIICKVANFLSLPFDTMRPSAGLVGGRAGSALMGSTLPIF